MRTIKFRGKCAKDSRYSGEWVDGACVQCEKSNDVLIIYAINDRNSCSYHVVPDTVGQFTGLYDKNGEEIYEGDIIKTKFYGKEYGNINVPDFDMFIVKFIDGCFRVVNIEGTRMFYLQDGSHFEIVGNIHDNTELQKGGEE